MFFVSFSLFGLLYWVCVHVQVGLGLNVVFCFPKQHVDETHLQHEHINGTTWRTTIQSARNDSLLNGHSRVQLQHWRANCDMSLVVDAHSAAAYLCKYALESPRPVARQQRGFGAPWLIDLMIMMKCLP